MKIHNAFLHDLKLRSSFRMMLGLCLLAALTALTAPNVVTGQTDPTSTEIVSFSTPWERVQRSSYGQLRNSNLLDKTHQLIEDKRNAKKETQAAFDVLREEYVRNPEEFERDPELVAQWKKLCIALGKESEFKPYTTEEQIAKILAYEAAELARQRADAEAAQLDLEKQAADRVRERVKEAELALESDRSSDGIAILIDLATMSDLPAGVEARVLEVLDKLTDQTSQICLIEHCSKYMGNWEKEEYAAFELCMMWYAYRAIGEDSLAETALETAMTRVSRMESSDSATNAGAQIGGWLCQWKQDEEAMRMLELSIAAVPHAETSEAVTCAYAGALAFLMGHKERAESLRIHARSLMRQVWSRDYTDSIYYAISGDFERAEPALERYRTPSNAAVVAIAAAAAGNERVYILAKRHAIDRLSGWEGSGKGGDLGGVRVQLVHADSIFGAFELAERRAASMSDFWNWRAYSVLAREYAKAGRVDDAKLAFERTYLCPQAFEAAFYITKSMIRDGSKMGEAIRYAVGLGSDTARFAAICGIVAGLNEDLTTRTENLVPFN